LAASSSSFEHFALNSPAAIVIAVAVPFMVTNYGHTICISQNSAGRLAQFGSEEPPALGDARWN
jgi:hypothetical protein